MISVPGCSLSAGRAVSLLALAPAGVSPVTLVPQESRTFHFNQLFIEDFQAKKELLKVNFRLSGQPHPLFRRFICFTNQPALIIASYHPLLLEKRLEGLF
ncbi:hypothetical protein [Fictibacillus sp. FJAT-27399]|uniref:hypothetical protein n=1 Tax=Fictibacillus sp. FJAT-27399 TaxID=1729689 RepID=UPI0012E36CA2|nr:hypothetical protein [Fictibacillus sp. FJAT-27399]